MKNIFKIIVLIAAFMPHFLMAQAVEKNTLVLGVKYYNDNNAAVEACFCQRFQRLFIHFE